MENAVMNSSKKTVNTVPVVSFSITEAEPRP